ncbi:MAG: hypothetical protein A3F72_02495 [Bacteroidetes bacterium RIFCSPLOWO2_12_FULL_35_15]|nr:MAG: hypothetical protein A3F72_02495 [Bacteroidetes bacterium RIFCSPLOWO2_12_FULL_35_15]
MTKEEIAESIEQEFFITYKSVMITYKDHKIFYGFFQNFEDQKELKNDFKYRFVPNNNSAAFYAELGNGKLNFEHSIIIDCAKIAKIVLV